MRIIITISYCLALSLTVWFLIPPILAQTNASLPTIANPFDNLQVKIPGMKRFSDALVTKDETTGQYKIQTAWIAEYLAGLYGYIISIVGILAAMTFIIGAVIYLTSAGNASRVGEAKSWMISSVFGLILALSSYLILYLINPALVTFRGLTIQAVQEDNYTPTAGAGELTGTYTGRPSFTKNNNTYDTLIKQAADQYKVDPTLVKAIMIAESNGRANALSSVGARGLMQLMPGTAKNLGFNIEDLYDPASSLMAGSKYLASLYSRACNGQTGNEVCNVNDWRYIIAAYNGGPGANKPSKSCPGLTYWECMVNVRYGQTRSYVNKVIANYNYLKQQGW